MQEPTFEEMIPWTYDDLKSGECPWDGDVYFVLSGTDMYFGEGYIHRENGKSDVDWGFQRNPEASVIAYMPVELWGKGYRRPNNCCIPADVKLDLVDKDNLNQWQQISAKYVDWSEVLLWKTSQSTWNPTAATLDSMAKHCDENIEELMKTNSTGDWSEFVADEDLAEKGRPEDFMGRALFKDCSLEDLFGLYKDYKLEKESAESMMEKVVQEIEYRTPAEWKIFLKDGIEDVVNETMEDLEEAPSENPEEAIVNDWMSWDEGDTIKCMETSEDFYSKGNEYQIITVDVADRDAPILIRDDDGCTDWVDLGCNKFIKVGV